MNSNQTILFVICYSIAVILIYKYIVYKKKSKNMELIDATCTDTTLRTTYQKNIRMYYYKYSYNNEEYTMADKIRFMIPGFNPQIKKVFKIYVDPKNPNNCITPLEIFYGKIYLIGSVILLILPLLF